MGEGRLSISRGHQLGEAPRLSLVARAAPAAAAAAPAEPVSLEYKPVHDRLDALERLAKLRDIGVLSDEEFVAEKAWILGRAGEELVLNEPLLAAEPPAPRAPSLLGRLFGWKFIPVGLAAGLALSYASQPRETQRFFEEALRLFGV